MNSKKNFFTRKRIILLATAVVLLILAIVAFDTRLMVRKYSIEEEEIETPIRIALVTDLHSCYYGENQSDLIDAIAAENPDVILLGGDIFDDVKEARIQNCFSPVSQTNIPVIMSPATTNAGAANAGLITRWRSLRNTTFPYCPAKW